jgi:hypothetical protein
MKSMKMRSLKTQVKLLLGKLLPTVIVLENTSRMQEDSLKSFSNNSLQLNRALGWMRKRKRLGKLALPLRGAKNLMLLRYLLAKKVQLSALMKWCKIHSLLEVCLQIDLSPNKIQWNSLHLKKMNFRILCRPSLSTLSPLFRPLSMETTYPWISSSPLTLAVLNKIINLNKSQKRTSASIIRGTTAIRLVLSNIYNNKNTRDKFLRPLKTYRYILPR